MKKLKMILLVAVCIALTSQVNIALYVPGFVVSLSVIILPLLLYFNRELKPIVLILITGTAFPLYRGFMLYINNTNLTQIPGRVLPDIPFYFAYGLIYYFLYWRRKNANLKNFFISTVISDFVSNVLELSVMLNFTGYKYVMFQDLAVVAFIRTIIAVCVILLLRYYSLLLVKEEHEERYRKLVLITSKVKNEIYYMNKNKTDIEDVMKKAYSLYKTLSSDNYPTEFANMSLDVAKDVHEIKKDYTSVIKGLDELFDEKFDDVKMSIKDIANIIEDDVNDYIKRNKLDIYLEFKVYENFSVDKHYYMVSIIRNLIYNSIEAMKKSKNGYIKIVIKKDLDECTFVVSDNGEGIKNENLEYIFNPGFSTKFNEATGDICRGIGLAHVKGIVNDIFDGVITVLSEEGNGTEFTIKIKKDKIEGDT